MVAAALTKCAQPEDRDRQAGARGGLRAARADGRQVLEEDLTSEGDVGEQARFLEARKTRDRLQIGELARDLVVPRSVERAAHAGLHGGVRIDYSFLDGSLERRAVEVLLAEVLLPGVSVRVELHEREQLRAWKAEHPGARASVAASIAIWFAITRAWPRTRSRSRKR